MRVRALIKALGGPTVVAEALGQRVATVGNWSLRNAIAPEHHIAVWRLATEKGVDWRPPDADGLVLTPSAPNSASETRSRRGQRDSSSSEKAA